MCVWGGGRMQSQIFGGWVGITMVLTSPSERQYRSASTQCVSSSIKLPLCQILLLVPLYSLRCDGEGGKFGAQIAFGGVRVLGRKKKKIEAIFFFLILSPPRVPDIVRLVIGRILLRCINVFRITFLLLLFLINLIKKRMYFPTNVFQGKKK